MAPVSVGGVNASVNPTMLSNHREVVTVVADTVTEQCDARWSGAGRSRVEPGGAGWSRVEPGGAWGGHGAAATGQTLPGEGKTKSRPMRIETETNIDNTPTLI